MDIISVKQRSLIQLDGFIPLHPSVLEIEITFPCYFLSRTYVLTEKRRKTPLTALDIIRPLKTFDSAHLGLPTPALQP